MTSVEIDESHIGDLTGKVGLITGGASGIGFAAACILAEHGADVHILDLHPPSTSSVPAVKESLPPNIHFDQCDVNDWSRMRRIFSELERLDYVFANAGISETEHFLADSYEEYAAEIEMSTTCLREPSYPLFGTNLRAVLNTIKLAHHTMKRLNTAGSIVITSSATAYAPEQSLPVYSAIKIALIGLVRSLRHNLPQDNITINAVVPAATETKLIAPEFVAPIKQAGLPMSSARHVGMALVYSAVARETRKVEMYGKDQDDDLNKEGRWNGRVILTLGDTYTELEQTIADLRPQWFGERNTELTRRQQSMTDFRDGGKPS